MTCGALDTNLPEALEIRAMPQSTSPNHKLEALKSLIKSVALEEKANKLTLEARDALRLRDLSVDQNDKMDDAAIEIVIRAWCIRDRLPPELQHVREEILKKAVQSCVSCNQHLIWAGQNVEVGPRLVDLFCFSIRDLLGEA
jgi:hypothetical protein